MMTLSFYEYHILMLQKYQLLSIASDWNNTLNSILLHIIGTLASDDARYNLVKYESSV